MPSLTPPAIKPADEFRHDPTHPAASRRCLLTCGRRCRRGARAEGGGGGGPTFANRTPMRIGMVTIRVRNLDFMADYYRDVLGLSVTERWPRRRTRRGRGETRGARARPDAAREARTAAGLYHTAFLMPTRKDRRAGWSMRRSIACRCRALPITSSASPSIPTTPKATTSTSMPTAIRRCGNGATARWRWRPTSSTSTISVSLTNTRVSDYSPRRPTACASATCICASAISHKAHGFYRDTLGFDPTRTAQRRRVPFFRPLPSPSRAQRLAKRRRRPPRRDGHRPCLVLAGDRQGGSVRGEGRAAAPGRRRGLHGREWDRGRRPLGYAGATDQGLN